MQNWPAPSSAFQAEMKRQMPLDFNARKKNGTPVDADEAARRIGVTLDTFYRNWRTYVSRDGMPAPLVEGRITFSRARFDQWEQGRDEAQRLPAAANENESAGATLAAIDAMTDAEQRAFAMRLYGGYR